MVKEKTTEENLNLNLKRLSEITEWFDNQEEVDVEQGLKMVKEAVGLIKTSKDRLKKIENEFEEIKKEVSLEEEDEKDSDDAIKDINAEPDKETSSQDIPF